MNRIKSILVMQARDRGTWFVNPWGVFGASFIIVWIIALLVRVFRGGQEETFTGALAAFYFVMLVTGILAVTQGFPFALGFAARRKDYLLGTLAMAIAVSAASSIVLGLLSMVEADVIHNWGIGLHFLHLPFFSDGSPLRQFCWTSDAACEQPDPNYVHGGVPLGAFWFSFILLLFMCLLGLMVGSIFQRFSRVGIYISAGVVFLLLSVFVLLGSSWGWWSTIFAWLAQQTAAGLAWWLCPPMACFALVSYVLLRKAAV
ncbi:MAG TPA: hypothetical protein VGP82_24535 [Ktedonobacterales bacterium]|nr:hypothetical protein [Ktedonobacterales bacterium]